MAPANGQNRSETNASNTVVGRDADGSIVDERAAPTAGIKTGQPYVIQRVDVGNENGSRDLFLTLTRDALQTLPLPESLEDSLWMLEEVDWAPDYYRIRHCSKPTLCLHLQHGTLELGTAESNWHSACWALDRIIEGDFYRVWNLDRPDDYLCTRGTTVTAAARAMPPESMSWRFVSRETITAIQQRADTGVASTATTTDSVARSRKVEPPLGAVGADTTTAENTVPSNDDLHTITSPADGAAQVPAAQPGVREQATDANSGGLPGSRRLVAKSRIWTKTNGDTFSGVFVRLDENDNVVVQHGVNMVSTPRLQLSRSDQRYVEDLTAASRPLRTWTDTSGRTVEAALVDVDSAEKDITLQLPDGSVRKVNIERLSMKDRRYIADYTRVRPLTLRERFEFLDARAGDAPVGKLARLIADYDNKAELARNTRISALREIAGFGAEATVALPFLRRVLLDEDLEARGIVVEALVNIGEPSVPTLVAILEAMQQPFNFRTDLSLRSKPEYSPLVLQAIRALRAIGPRATDAVPILVKLSVESPASFKNRVDMHDPPSVRGRPTSSWFDATSFDNETLKALSTIGPDPRVIRDGLLQVLDTNSRRLADSRSRPALRAPDVFPGVLPGRALPDSLESPIARLTDNCVAAMAMLDQMERLPAKSLPSLRKLLETGCASSQVIDLLTKVDAEAKTILPILQPLLDDRVLGKDAENAIAKIQGTVGREDP